MPHSLLGRLARVINNDAERRAVSAVLILARNLASFPVGEFPRPPVGQGGSEVRVQRNAAGRHAQRSQLAHQGVIIARRQRGADDDVQPAGDEAARQRPDELLGSGRLARIDGAAEENDH